jgi:hypothetical protein
MIKSILNSNNIFTPQDLLDYLIKLKIVYGYYDTKEKKIINDQNKLFFDDDYLEKYCYILSPEQVLKYKVAICWDSCLLIYKVLKLLKLEVQVPFIVVQKINDKSDITTHTPVIYKNNNKYYWFEFSWKLMRNIHGDFNSYNEVIDYIIYQMIKRNKNTKLLKINYNLPIEKIISNLPMKQSKFYNIGMNIK